MLGNFAVKSEQVCFLSKLLGPGAETYQQGEQVPSSAHQIQPMLPEGPGHEFEEESAGNRAPSDSGECAPPAFDLSQIDFSDLQDAPGGPDPASQAKSAGETAIEKEEDFLQIELPDLDTEVIPKQEVRRTEAPDEPDLSQVDLSDLKMELSSDQEAVPEGSEAPLDPELDLFDPGMELAPQDETSAHSPAEPARPHLDLSDFGIDLSSQEEIRPEDSEAPSGPQLDLSDLGMETASSHETKDDGSREPDLHQIDLSDLEMGLNSPDEQTSSEELGEPETEADRIFLDLDDKADLDLILQPEREPANGYGGPLTMPVEEGPKNKTVKLDKASRAKKEDKDKDPPPAPTGTSGRKGRGRKKSKDAAPAMAFSGLNLYLDRAGLFQRFGASVFDLCLVSMLGAFLFLTALLAVRIGPSAGLSEGLLDSIALVILPFQFGMILLVSVYSIFFHGYSGQTPGKMLFDLKVVHTSGLPLGYAHSFLRLAGAVLSAIPLTLGFFWAAFDKNKQTWHDKLTDTYVVRII